MIRAGIVMLLLSIAPITWSLVPDNPQKWTPVDIPLEFNARGKVRQAFTPRIRSNHYVEIRLRRNLPEEQMADIVRALRMKPFEPDGKLGRKSPLPRVTYTVMCQGADVFMPYEGTVHGRTLGVTVGQFIGEPGRTYEIRAKASGPIPRLELLQPRLQVKADPIIHKQHLVGKAVSLLNGIILAAIGLTVNIIFLLRRRRKT